jgi:nucleoside-diphosphate-sugar epimerase
MRKLVIGCGYVGKRVAAKWSASGDEVFALTRSADRAEEFRNLGWIPVLGDVTQPETLKALPDVDLLLYAVGFDRSAGFSQREIYVEGLKNVLDTLADRVGKWLYVSSTSVYGQQDGEWIDEKSLCQPTKINGQICQEAEMIFAQNSIQANVLRLAGIYGPGRLLRRVADLKAGLPIKGDPEGWLNLIHVDDVVQSILACEQRGKPGQVYLISDDRPVRRREYYQLLAELAGVDMPPFDPGTEPQHAEGLGKRCSNRKLHEELGVELLYPTIEEGLPQAFGSDS